MTQKPQSSANQEIHIFWVSNDCFLPTDNTRMKRCVKSDLIPLGLQSQPWKIGVSTSPSPQRQTGRSCSLVTVRKLQLWKTSHISKPLSFGTLTAKNTAYAANRSKRRRNSAICAGPTSQQPPIILAPCCAQLSAKLA